MFGCPIGELFDLERLSEACQKHQRYTFFLTSAPIRGEHIALEAAAIIVLRASADLFLFRIHFVATVKGGIASSPNAICIF